MFPPLRDSPRDPVLMRMQMEVPFGRPTVAPSGSLPRESSRRIDISGGPAQALCDVTIPTGIGSWNRDGVIIFGRSGVGEGLYRTAAIGGGELSQDAELVLLGRIVMSEISEWTWIFPPLRDRPRDPALIRMQMEVPSSLEKPQ